MTAFLRTDVQSMTIWIELSGRLRIYQPQTGQVEQPSPKTSGPAQSGQRGC